MLFWFPKKDAGSGTHKRNANAVVQRFLAWFLTFVQTSEAYPAWVSFAGILPRLLAAGGEQTPKQTKDEANLLESLARPPL